MKQGNLIRLHIMATAIAVVTIASFFSFSLVAEILGDEVLIKQVKTAIVFCLPIMIVTMPILGLSGKKLAGSSNGPLIVTKMNRMKLIAANGIILILLAIYLYYHAVFKTINNTFLYVQIIELCMGAFNLILIAANIKSGMKLSSRKRKNSLQ